ncbi:hypothetical protein [Nocardia xishanensis]|uniref:HAD family hydrolase n=1 Tax=Nocardia xishanensis TaxID=238964 RepID=A0ABW7XA28_9NOCA
MTTTNTTIETIEELTQHPRNRPQVIFCDWHGVLCQKPYWHSITDNPEHPLHAILTGELDRLFTSGNREGRDWMCGTRSARDILTALTVHHPDFDLEQLLVQLAHDIADMPVDQSLLHALRRARTSAIVVLATDNIAEFTTAFRAAKLSRAVRPPQPGSFADAASTFDDILSSSESGVLKSENPQAFFGPWLAKTGWSFTDALLIDDRADNCTAFERLAGATVTWNPANNTAHKRISPQ